MPISISSREDTNNASMIAPASKPQGKLTLRPISLGSLEIMRHINNPLATGATGEEVDTHVIAEYIWVHAAPLDDVIETVYNHPTQVERAVTLFCMDVSPSDIRNIGAALAGDRAAIQSASAAPIPDDNNSPNRQAHP